MNYISQTRDFIVINGKSFPAEWLIERGFPCLMKGIQSFHCNLTASFVSTGDSQLSAFHSQEEREEFLTNWSDRLPQLEADYLAEIEPEVELEVELEVEPEFYASNMIVDVSAVETE